MRVLVVGSGLAGLVCAREVASALPRAQVVVVDGAAGPGGRLHSVPSFDVGAQYFTARGPALQAELQGWIRDGVAAPWEPRRGIASVAWGKPGSVSGLERGQARFVGVPTMASMALRLADELRSLPNVRMAFGLTVHTLDRGRSGLWTAASRDEPVATARSDVLDAPFDAAAVATPPGCAAALLRAEPALARQLEAAAASMGGCWAVLAGFATPLDLPFDGAFVNTSVPVTGSDGSFVPGPHGDGDVLRPPLTWVCRNSSKPGRPDGLDCWVLHSSAAFLEAHRDADPAEAAERLLAHFDQGVRLPHGAHLERPEVLEGHAWLASLPVAPLSCGCLWNSEARVGVAGDWLSGSRVEGAYDSGLQLGRAMGAQLT